VEFSGKTFYYDLVMHVFKIGTSFYIAQKSIEVVDPDEKNSKGLLGFAPFISKQSQKRNAKLIIFRISNTRKNGECEVLVEAIFD
jgi:hypothetical protein